MIISFRHKGLELFFETGNSRLILSNPSFVSKIRLILGILDKMRKIEDANLPHLKFHKLTGDLKGYYSLKVNSNWRIIFEFDGKDVYNVNLIDYH